MVFGGGAYEGGTYVTEVQFQTEVFLIPVVRVKKVTGKGKGSLALSQKNNFPLIFFAMVLRH